MRVTSVIWLAVFMRKEASRGAYVTVAKKGAQQAGAIFVLHNHLDGTFDIYGPAPQSMFEANQSERQFELIHQKVQQDTADQYFEKQKSFDPDLWIIETESGSGEISLEVMS
ncbi:MAG: DUF1491 family protein [Pseudomonadota bacterium]